MAGDLFSRPTWEPDPDMLRDALGRPRDPRMFNSMAVSDQTRSRLGRTQLPSTISPQFPAGAFDVPQYESSFETPQWNQRFGQGLQMRDAVEGMVSGAGAAGSALNSYADAMRMPRPEAVARGAGAAVGGAFNALGQVVGPPTGALTRAGMLTLENPPIDEYARRMPGALASGWRDKASFMDEFGQRVPEPFTPLAQGAGFVADLFTPGPGEMASAAHMLGMGGDVMKAGFGLPPALVAIHRMMGTPQRRARTAGSFLDFNNAPRSLLSMGKAPMNIMGGENAVGAAADIQKYVGLGELDKGVEREARFIVDQLRKKGVKPTNDPDEVARRYAASVIEDFPWLSQVFPKETRFYEDHSTNLPGLVGELAKSIARKHPRAAEYLDTPYGRDFMVAVTVPHSAGNNPHSEVMGGIEMTTTILDNYLGGVPLPEIKGAIKFKTGTLNARTGKGLGWGPYSKNVLQANHQLLDFVDSFPAATRQGKLDMAMEWLNSKHSLQEIAQASGVKPMAGGKKGQIQVVGMHGKLTPKRSESYSKVPMSPQAVDENGEVYGWFALGPKVGPYAMSKTGLTTRFAVYDVHAARDVNLHRLDPFKTTKAGNEKLWEGPRDRADRYAYQRGNDIASDVLGVDVGRIQAARWYGKKSLDEFFGVRTPGGTSTSAYDEAKGLADAAGPDGLPRSDPFPDREKRITSWQQLRDYVRKGTFTPDQADAAAQDLGFTDYGEFEVALREAESRRVEGKPAKKPVPPKRESTR